MFSKDRVLLCELEVALFSEIEGGKACLVSVPVSAQVVWGKKAMQRCSKQLLNLTLQ